MATKTVILRPTSGNFYDATERYPSTTSNNNVYLLVAEEVADDDATYYTAVNALPPTGVNFSLPDEYINMIPISIRCITRLRATSSSVTYVGLNLAQKSENTNMSNNMTAQGYIKPNDTYDTYTFELTAEEILGFWYIIVNNLTDTTIPHVGFTSKGDDAKSSVNSHITQVYLEIDFEVEEPTGIFIKRNNNFIEATKAYQKISGAWVEITADECKTLIQSANEGG